MAKTPVKTLRPPGAETAKATPPKTAHPPREAVGENTMGEGEGIVNQYIVIIIYTVCRAYRPHKAYKPHNDYAAWS